MKTTPQSLDDYIFEMLPKESYESQILISALYILFRHFVQDADQREEYFEKALDTVGELINESKTGSKE